MRRCKILLITLFLSQTAVPVPAVAAMRMIAQDKIQQPTRSLLPAGRGQRPFDVTRHAIPLNEIDVSGPPRDGIPALLHPRFVSAGDAAQVLRASDRIVGVHLNGQAKAYPIKILNYHELVNDTVAGQPVLVSW